MLFALSCFILHSCSSSHLIPATATAGSRLSNPDRTSVHYNLRGSYLSVIFYWTFIQHDHTIQDDIQQGPRDTRLDRNDPRVDAGRAKCRGRAEPAAVQGDQYVMSSSLFASHLTVPVQPCSPPRQERKRHPSSSNLKTTSRAADSRSSLPRHHRSTSPNDNKCRISSSLSSQRTRNVSSPASHRRRMPKRVLKPARMRWWRVSARMGVW